MMLFHAFIDYQLDKSKDSEEIHSSLFRYAILADSYYLVIDKVYQAFVLERTDEVEKVEKDNEESDIEKVMRLL